MAGGTVDLEDRVTLELVADAGEYFFSVGIRRLKVSPHQQHYRSADDKRQDDCGNLGGKFCSGGKRIVQGIFCITMQY